MQRVVLSILVLFVLSMSVHAQNAKLKYKVDLNTSSDDLFRVSLDVSGLKSENNIYQFAATAPGTYQPMDIGRFVREFKAFDKKGKEIATKKISENQFELSEPTKVKTITYQIAETWDTPVKEQVVYKMCGTSIEKDHVLFNSHCVLGYPKGMQGEPLEIKLEYPTEWQAGTSLAKNASGSYLAKNYDHAVDSPILLGRLSKASTDLNGSTIEIYTYSKTDKIKSEDLLNSMKEMLKAAGAFVVNFPVDRYAFLFHFEDETWGAWEHSYSSEYVFEEQEFTPEYGALITSTAAHEFFHVITPLNIHSEIIEQFNFVTPTASEHLWLYEGTTEWASDAMQLRYGMIDLPKFLNEMKQKLVTDARYDQSYSLSKLSLTSFTPEGQRQYGNIYMRGAVVAALLDIRLLELSNGKRGLREVVNELSKKYGPSKSFPEKDFFNIFTAMTYPEIADFFDKYIKNANPLPVGDYFGKLGINYTPEAKTGKTVPTLGMGFDVPDGKIRLVKIKDELKQLGLMDNDELVSINGTPVTLQNGREIIGKLNQQPIGHEYDITVKRDDKDVTIKSKILSKEEVVLHSFEVNADATAQQVALREAWMKNL